MEEALLLPATSCAVPCRPHIVIAAGSRQGAEVLPHYRSLACRVQLQLVLCTPGPTLALVTSWWLVCLWGDVSECVVVSLVARTAMSTVTSHVERAQPYPITHL